MHLIATTPSVLVMTTCSWLMLSPISLIVCGFLASGLPTVVRPGLRAYMIAWKVYMSKET